MQSTILKAADSLGGSNLTSAADIYPSQGPVEINNKLTDSHISWRLDYLHFIDQKITDYLWIPFKIYGTVQLRKNRGPSQQRSSHCMKLNENELSPYQL